MAIQTPALALQQGREQRILFNLNFLFGRVM